jgi:putative acetyltransferase
MPAEPAISLCTESPDQADVRDLLSDLDAYLRELYAPEHNHILDIGALRSPQVRFVVARHRGRAVGCGAVRFMPPEAATADEAYGEIKRMFVSPEMRGAGVGRRLLGELEAIARGQGVGLALLETGASQPAALRLYERCGYTARAPFGGYAANGTSVFYAKRLA